MRDKHRHIRNCSCTALGLVDPDLISANSRAGGALIRTALPFWGQFNSKSKSFVPKRDCGSKRVNRQRTALTFPSTAVFYQSTSNPTLIAAPGTMSNQVLRGGRLIRTHDGPKN